MLTRAMKLIKGGSMATRTKKVRLATSSLSKLPFWYSGSIDTYYSNGRPGKDIQTLSGWSRLAD